MQRSALRTILFVAFVDLVAFGLIIPLQANYAHRLGATGLTFGFLVGVYALMQFVFNPILGRWSDRIGRRRVIMICVAGSVVSHALLGVADLACSLPLLFVARTLDGITGANIATAQAYIADITTSQERARGMGLFGAAFGLGFVIGPALGAGLVDIGNRVSGPMFGTAWPAFGSAVIAGIAVFLVWRYLPEPRREVGAPDTGMALLSLYRLRTLMKKPRLLELNLLLFCATFAFVFLEVTIVYLCMDELGLNERGTGLLFAYLGIIMVLVQGGLVGRLVARFGEMRLLCVAPFLTAIGFMVISCMNSTVDRHLAWILLLAGSVPMAVGHGLTGPNLSALISRQAFTGGQGATLGLSQGIGSLARALAPPVGGYLYELGPAVPYQTGAGLLAAVGLLAILIAPIQRAALGRRR